MDNPDKQISFSRIEHQYLLASGWQYNKGEYQYFHPDIGTRSLGPPALKAQLKREYETNGNVDTFATFVRNAD